MNRSYDSRLRISLAQEYILNNLNNEIKLEDIARVSGISQFHFIRIFKAYFGETPFEFMRRKRALLSLELLEKMTSITDIALEVGFDSSSSFNKFFKKKLNITPSHFRKLERSEKEKLFIELNSSPTKKALSMNLNMDENFEIIIREEVTFFTTEVSGKSFIEIAPITWDNFLSTINNSKQDISESEFLALSYIQNSLIEDKSHIYKVGITCSKEKPLSFKHLKKDKIKKTKYAKFILKGSYLSIWPAFERIFKILSETDLALDPSPCLENYLNNPKITPEEDLLTELLVPLK